MRQKIIIWVIAAVITMLAGYWQRTSGPTYPLKAATTVNDTTLQFEFLRSHGGEEDAEIVIPADDEAVTGEIHWRRFPIDTEWQSAALERREGELVGTLPHQPPAGKLEYYLSFSKGGTTAQVGEEKPVVIRFKGAVPLLILIPHIFCMFMGMLVSNAAGLMVLFKDERFRRYTIVALVFIGVGGMILGPAVQWFAFGEWWTGVPFGWDLTDNKTLIGFVALIIAVVGNIKKPRPWLTLAAAVVMLVIFSIPHSMFGSEFDYTSGTITQG